MKRAALAVAIVMLTLALCWAFWQIRAIILVFIVSLVIAAALRTPVDLLVGRGLRPVFSIAVVYALVLVGLIGLARFVGVSIVNDIRYATGDLSGSLSNPPPSWQPSGRLDTALRELLPTPSQVAALLAGDYLEEFTATSIRISRGASAYASRLILALVLSIYWSADRSRFERLLLSLLPVDQRTRARRLWTSLEYSIGAYARSSIGQSLLAGGILTLGFVLMDVRYPFLLAFLAALSLLIPVAGSIVAIGIIAVFAWQSVEPIGAIILVLYTIAIVAALRLFIQRRLLPYEPIQKVILLPMYLVLADVYGLLGLFVAPYVAIAIQQFLSEAASRFAVRQRRERLSEDISSLQSRLQEATSHLPSGESGASTNLQDMAKKLHKALQDAAAIQYSKDA